MGLRILRSSELRDGRARRIGWRISDWFGGDPCLALAARRESVAAELSAAAWTLIASVVPASVAAARLDLDRVGRRNRRRRNSRIRNVVAHYHSLSFTSENDDVAYTPLVLSIGGDVAGPI